MINCVAFEYSIVNLQKVCELHREPIVHVLPAGASWCRIKPGHEGSYTGHLPWEQGAYLPAPPLPGMPWPSTPPPTPPPSPSPRPAPPPPPLLPP
eukprot:402247-Pleurochrysis_carterae.AAC.3